MGNWDLLKPNSTCILGEKGLIGKQMLLVSVQIISGIQSLNRLLSTPAAIGSLHHQHFTEISLRVVNIHIESTVCRMARDVLAYQL